MVLLDLNDDILLQIATYFGGSNAINLTLTCRRLHDLASRRVVAEIHCRSPHSLEAAHGTLLRNQARPLARSVEGLFIHNSTFEGPVYMLNMPPDRYPSESQGLLILDILSATKNLRVLYLKCFAALIGHVSQIATSVCALQRLDALDIDINDQTFDALRHMRSRPSWLWLERDEDLHEFSAENPELTRNELLSFLDAVPSVRTLGLTNFRASGPWPPHSQTFSLPGIREIHIEAYGLSLLDFPSYCPNLISVTNNSLRNTSPPSMAQWPRLRELVLASLEWAVEVPGNLNTVDLVVIEELWHIWDMHTQLYQNHWEAFWATVSPIGVMLGLQIQRDAVPAIVPSFSAAPRLRFAVVRLRLEVPEPLMSLGRVGYAHGPIASVFRQVRLVCLVIRMERTRRPLLLDEDAGFERRLIEELVGAIPTLRFVAVANSKTEMLSRLSEDVETNGTAEEPWQYHSARRFRKIGRGRCRWWRITREGGPDEPELEEMWEVDGLEM